MQGTWLIAKRDFRAYFTSPIAYFVYTVFLFLIGWMFFGLLSYFQQQMENFSAYSAGAKPNLAESVIRPLYGNMNVILLFIIPLVTMRLLAEERKEHTVELLFTAPIKPFSVIFGKFLSAFLLIAVMLTITLVYPLVLILAGTPDVGGIAGCYLGLLLVTATYVAVGLFWSATTENQIVAAFLTFGTLLFFWLINWAAHQVGSFWGDVLNYLSIIGHFTNFSQGVIDTSDVVYYLSFITIALFAAHTS